MTLWASKRIISICKKTHRLKDGILVPKGKTYNTTLYFYDGKACGFDIYEDIYKSNFENYYTTSLYDEYFETYEQNLENKLNDLIE